MRRYLRDVLWIGFALGVGAVIGLRSSGFWLAVEFRLALVRGITFEMRIPDENVHLTFQGSTFSGVDQVLRPVFGPAEPSTFSGTTVFHGGHLTLHVTGGSVYDKSHKQSDITLVLEPAHMQPGDRFALRPSPDVDAIYGPVRMP